jgi:4-amino-4-deoxy-L-arabinose transferase-like glycosyltransferase
VTQTDSSAINNHPITPAARAAWILLILATLYICYFNNLGAIGLVGPDEPRYAWIARDMAETGNWITPKLYGQPWFEKPVLYYWSAAISFKLFGVNETTARLPCALFALLATLAMAWLAWRVYNAETAHWFLVLLPTTVGMLGFSHAASTDMPFAATLTIAMVFAAAIFGLVRDQNSLILPRTPWLALLLFGFFLGLAVLAKGPAAIVLSGGAVLLWATFTKRWRDAFRCLHPVAIASFCFTALPWYILCARRNADFFRIFIIEHNFKRYFTPEFQHIQPFWYYLPIIFIALFPWFFFLVPSLQRAFVKDRRNQPDWAVFLFFALWAGFPLLFFSISKSKLPGYILPSLPPLGMLLATTVAKQSAEKKLSSRWPVLASAAVLLLFGIALQQQAKKFPALLCASPLCGLTRISLLAVSAAIVITILALRWAKLPLLALACFTLLLVVEIDRYLPGLDPGISARDATQVVNHVWPDFAPGSAATWQLKRSFAYQLNFYFQKDLPEWNPEVRHSTFIFVAQNKVQAARALGLECVEFAIYPAVVPCRESASVSGGNRFSSLGTLDGSDRSGANGQSR